MLKQIKKWFRNEELEKRMEALEQQLTQANDELVVFRKQKAEDEARRKSTVPWVEVTSQDYDAVKGFRIELDWNEAFIQYLKEAGIQGKTDEQMIQKWLGFLYADLIDKLEDQVIEDTSGQQESDYE